jgi:hypothetical protein
VRFVLPVSSYLTGDFDLLPAIKEKCHSRKSPKSSSASPRSADTSLALPKSLILRMKTSVLPEVLNEMWMNVDHEEQEENHEYNGMILVISLGGVELKDAYNECHNIGESICIDDDDDSFNGDANAGTTPPRDIPLNITIPVVAILEDDISQIYNKPDCYIMRDDERLSTQKVAALHGLLLRVQNLVSELGPPPCIQSLYMAWQRMI